MNFDELSERSVVTVEELAPLLGMSPRSVHRAMDRGEIPEWWCGRRRLVPVPALLSALGAPDGVVRTESRAPTKTPATPSSPTPVGLSEHSVQAIVDGVIRQLGITTSIDGIGRVIQAAGRQAERSVSGSVTGAARQLRETLADQLAEEIRSVAAAVEELRETLGDQLAEEIPTLIARVDLEAGAALARAKTKDYRTAVIERDGYQCRYCGKHLKANEIALDHYMPVGLGGQSNMHNLVVACSACNSRKGRRSPTSLPSKGMALRAAPDERDRLRDPR